MHTDKNQDKALAAKTGSAGGGASKRTSVIGRTNLAAVFREAETALAAEGTRDGAFEGWVDDSELLDFQVWIPKNSLIRVPPCPSVANGLPPRFETVRS